MDTVRTDENVGFVERSAASESGVWITIADTELSANGSQPLPILHSNHRDHAHTELIRDVGRGLQSRPRSLKLWMLYDEHGSELFERITHLPEYYPTRIERSILETHADSVVAAVCCGSRPLRILELGAGTTSKTRLFLAAAARRRDRRNLHAPGCFG